MAQQSRMARLLTSRHVQDGSESMIRHNIAFWQCEVVLEGVKWAEG